MHATHADHTYVPDADWRQIDSAIIRLARSRGEQEFEEGRWLIAARRAAIHLRFGFASFAEYVSRRLGHDPRSTAERLRVATALADLPRLAEALRTGAIPWTAIRELVRVAVPATEIEWRDAARNKTVRQIEQLVSGLVPGDLPGTPKDPALRKHPMRFELPAETFAILRDALDRARKEIDPALTDEEALRAIATHFLGGSGDEGRAPYQVSLTVCDGCGRTWQLSRGEAIEVDPEVGERAGCDAQIIGVAKPAEAESPTMTHAGHDPWAAARSAALAPLAPLARARQTITPKIRRFIFERDRGRCVVPGCTHTQYLEIHHLRFQSDGGSHDPENLGLICSAHHALIHQGRLIVLGTPSTGLRFTHADGTPYGSGPRPSDATALEDAALALEKLGIARARIRPLLTEAQKDAGPNANGPEILRRALQISAKGLAVIGRPKLEDEVRERSPGGRGPYAEAYARVVHLGALRTRDARPTRVERIRVTPSL